ncbi:B-cell lymphoma 3 protein isoform X2 [Brienomyrus brachyistius]|nr:B-cell lymphoma 3 protein isoform X2 [Brienomyrus brachyistius]
MDNDPKSSNAQSVSRLPLRKRPFPAPDNKKEAPPKRTKSIANLQNDPQQESPPPNAVSSEHPDKTPSDSRHTSHADIAPPCRPNVMDYYQIVSLPLAPVPLLPVERMEPSQVTMATWQDDDGDTALHIAVVQGLESVVRRLIQILLQAGKGLDIYNNLLQTPLHLAVITHQVLLVQLLLSAGADPTMLDRHGQTAAHLCCEHGLSSCLGLLLRHPASQTCLKVRNYEGLTVLHLAVQNSNKELVKMILDSGADINAVDFKSGRSPLIHAVENNSMEMINFLIESGSNVNMQSYSGNTALHSACGRGQVEAVRVLLKNGADSSLKNYHNDTALMVAKNKKVTDVLRGKGSRNQTTKTAEPSDSISPPRCTPQSHPHSTHGTPVQSPSHNLCPSPLATPTQLAPSLCRSNPGSPMAPPSHSPGTQSVEDHSGSQPMMAKQESKDQHLQCTQPSMRVNCETAPRMHIQPRLYLPADCPTYQSYFRDSTLGPIIPYPAYHNLLQTYPEQAYIFLPQLNYAQLSCYRPVQSRPSSRSSDQSDASTMSISSGGKGES